MQQAVRGFTVRKSVAADPRDVLARRVFHDAGARGGRFRRCLALADESATRVKGIARHLVDPPKFALVRRGERTGPNFAPTWLAPVSGACIEP